MMEVMPHIPELLERASAIRAAAEGLPDDLRGDIGQAAWKLEKAALGLPAAGVGDLKSKLRLWDELIADPQCILEEHVGLWEQLKADWRTVTEREVDEAIDRERENAGIDRDRAEYE